MPPPGQGRELRSKVSFREGADGYEGAVDMNASWVREGRASLPHAPAGCPLRWARLACTHSNCEIIREGCLSFSHLAHT